MMHFRSELKARFPSLRKDLGEFEGYMRDYEPRVRRLVRPSNPLSMEDSARILILSATASARQLTASIINAVNCGLILGAYLAARAHCEVAGFAAHICKTVERHKAGAITEDAAREQLHRLHVGMRYKLPPRPDGGEPPRR
jgi:hypothetical protein